MFSSALTFTLVSNLFLTSLALPSDHRRSSVPENHVDRSNRFTAPSAASLESSTFPPITDHLPTNLTALPLTCYAPPPSGPPRPAPTGFDCFQAMQLILLEPNLFDAKIWSGTQGLKVAEWRSATCSVSLMAQTPFSEDRFAPVLAAWAAAHLIRTCVMGPNELGGLMPVGHHTTFSVTVTGTGSAAGGAVGGGTATS